MELNELFHVLPPDVLHTVHAGAIRYVVCWSLSIIKVNKKWCWCEVTYFDVCFISVLLFRKESINKF